MLSYPRSQNQDLCHPSFSIPYSLFPIPYSLVPSPCLFQRRGEAGAGAQNYGGDYQEDQRCAEAEAQVCAVGDGADDGGREGVAEEMDAEEVE